jgi:hypothetical protein
VLGREDSDRDVLPRLRLARSQPESVLRALREAALRDWPPSG